MEFYSLNELNTYVELEDLHVACTVTIQVEVSMEQSHHYTKDDAGNAKLVQDKGLLVSLTLRLPPSDSRLFSDGESLMVCDLRYLSESCGPIQLEEAIRALCIDPSAKIWRLRPAS